LFVKIEIENLKLLLIVFRVDESFFNTNITFGFTISTLTREEIVQALILSPTNKLITATLVGIWDIPSLKSPIFINQE
jgi:hypothetical protein